MGSGDSTGTCQTGTSDPTACGFGGAACMACATGQMCVSANCTGASSSSSSSSSGGSGSGGACGQQTGNSGCCDSTGTCQPGTSTTVCGQFGQRCMDCTNRGLMPMCRMPLHNICFEKTKCLRS